VASSLTPGSFSISGIVKDANDTPIANAQVVDGFGHAQRLIAVVHIRLASCRRGCTHFQLLGQGMCLTRLPGKLP
jgi:hypothetical protein